MNLIKQKEIVREIRENWDAIEAIEKGLFERGNEWIRELALQGQRLIHAKTQLKHGDWLPWCEAHFPGKYETIRRCIKIAEHWGKIEGLDESTSLRQALALCSPGGGPPAETPPPARRWPPYVEANLKLSKFAGYVERFPVRSWPAESQEKAREQLLPIARELWPEFFPDPDPKSST